MVASPRLSLCMIVRDSSRTLGSCLASIAPWVDESVIVDTGSEDETRQIAAEYGGRVFEFPWCDDFSAARNESLRHASGDWLFWMDSDDTISSKQGRKLRALADAPLKSGPTAYVMQVHCPGPPETTDCTVVDQVKMFRNDPRLRFEGRIHEQILPAVRRINGTVDWTDIYITHSGAEHSPEAKHRKQQRDLRLLEIDLSERPDHPFVLFNLGMTYADMDDAARAVDYLKKCLLASSPEESHVRKAYALLVGCLTQLGLDEQAMRVLRRGRELYPEDAELWFRLGILEHRAKNNEKAIEAYQAALNDHGVRYFSSRDCGVTGHKARHNLAGVYRDIGRLDLAELEWRWALRDQPKYRDGWRGLVETLLNQEKNVTLEVEIEMACNYDFPVDEVACAAAKLAARRGHVDEAITILDGALAEDIRAIEPLRLKCQLLFENFNAERSIAALEQLCRCVPEDGAAWHNLGMAYQKTGCHALAISSYQMSLAVRPDSIPTLVRLGDAQQELDRYEAAKKTWEKAKKIGSDR